MSVTPADRLAGILPVVISGGRPALRQRPTSKFLRVLQGVTADPVWLVRDDQAGEYEPDGIFEILTYPKVEAEEYAAAHWTAVEPFEAGGFTGAFCGREWACRLAAERGFWAVLQLDDNINWLGLFAGGGATVRVTRRLGGLGFFTDLLAAVTLSTNSVMTGAGLDAIVPGKEQVGIIARLGCPYSLFLERTGPGREPYFGPAEDDILHAYQYGANASPDTAALVRPLHYRKEHKSKTGMRSFYTANTRAAGLQRAAPEIAKIQVKASRSNGRGGPRVFHQLARDMIRTPLRVYDEPLFRSAGAALEAAAVEIVAEHRIGLKAKVERRAARAREVS